MDQFEDEIIIKDAAGRFKVLRGGKIYDLDETPSASVAPAAQISITPFKLADEVLRQSGISIEENLKARFGEILEAYKKDVRDKLETKSVLMRPVTAGGMGLTSEQADSVIKVVGERGKNLVAKEKAVPKAAAAVASTSPTKTPDAAPQVAAPPKSAAKVLPPRPAFKILPSGMATAVTKIAPETPGVAEFVFSPADEEEVLAHAEKLPVTMAGLKPLETAKFVDEILKKSGVVLDEMNQKKLEKILLTHLKDIRDGFETEETLINVTAGISLNPEQMGKILGAAKIKLQELEERTRKEQLGKVKEAMAGEKSETEKSRQEVEEKIKEKMDVRWQEITKKSAPTLGAPSELISPPIGMRAKISTLAPPAPSSVLKSTEVKTTVMPRAGFVEPIAPTIATVKSAGQKEISKTEQSAPEVEEKPKPLLILKPSAPPAVRRPPSLPDNRPRLDDVKHVPKLVGPIEELREMTLVDFRRLSNDPKVATQKISDKLNLLERESITKKIDGIGAWQESEINKIYKEISREVLQKGVPVNQVVSLRNSVNQPTLTVEEYQAVMALNRSLRY